MSTIHDPDVQAFATIAGSLESEYRQDEDPWLGSPFAWIRALPSRRRGKIGEQLIAGFLAARNFDVTRPGDSEADLCVNGHRVEIKFSTLWANGIYKFQQIRDQNYAVLICLGLNPFDARCWAIPKSLLKEHVIGVMGQHGGASGRDTAWMSFEPDYPYAWLKPYGGRLDAALQVMRSLLPRP